MNNNWKKRQNKLRSFIYNGLKKKDLNNNQMIHLITITQKKYNRKLKKLEIKLKK